MTKQLFSLAVLALAFALYTGGCASLNASSGGTSASVTQRQKFSQLDLSDLSNRDKWSLAREAYQQALHEEKRKDADAAAEFYEATLELLGSLDVGAIEVPAQRVLEFQRTVLASYNKFMASIETLPPTAGTAVVLEAVPDEEADDVSLPSKSEKDRDSVAPQAIVAHPNPLPEVPLTLNGQVSGQLTFFMNKGRKVMERWMERSALMFPRMRPILREEGMPDDLMFLAMIESGLNPRAYSYAHAAGVWQFIPGTGRIFGLQVNQTFDERLHVESATRAACRYLRKLYEEFGDWYLAFAAYNCGEQRVRREIARSHTTSYWRLNRLPKQTRSYVPAYLATKAICENPRQYGFGEMPEEIPFECDRIFVKDCYQLDQIAYAAGCDALEVRDLNPEFRRSVTPGGQTSMVRLPKSPRDDFEVRLASAPKSDYNPTTIHTVRRGETLKSIAARYGVTQAQIKAQPENKKARSGKLKSGMVLTIPTPAPQIVEAQPPAAPRTGEATSETSPAKESSEIVYTVHRGETLGRIAQQVGVSVSEICRQNGIKNPNKLEPGQKLRIRVDGSQSTVAEVSKTPKSDSVKAVAAKKTQGAAAATRHRVRAGETVWSIAQRYGADPSDILRWNHLSKRGRILVGQELVVSQ
ncbi:LysM peptidoglycan-binding domain-containing protein [candidate division KSB1 bacterium]|nr:LysM peptidoglycan-binding domain-containing protein [candidate division KSB1 bacterium]